MEGLQLVDKLLNNIKSITPGTKIRVTLKSLSTTAVIEAKLIKPPWLEDNRWLVKVRFKRQTRVDTLVIGVNLLAVREGWE